VGFTQISFKKMRVNIMYISFDLMEAHIPGQWDVIGTASIYNMTFLIAGLLVSWPGLLCSKRCTWSFKNQFLKIVWTKSTFYVVILLFLQFVTVLFKLWLVCLKTFQYKLIVVTSQFG